jgi:hypothetical protein
VGGGLPAPPNGWRLTCAAMTVAHIENDNYSLVLILANEFGQFLVRPRRGVNHLRTEKRASVTKANPPKFREAERRRGAAAC